MVLINVLSIFILDTCWKCLTVLILLGANMMFLMQHLVGLGYGPRRIFCYPEVYALWNMYANVGIGLVIVAVSLMFLMICYCC